MGTALLWSTMGTTHSTRIWAFTYRATRAVIMWSRIGCTLVHSQEFFMFGFLAATIGNSLFQRRAATDGNL